MRLVRSLFVVLSFFAALMTCASAEAQSYPTPQVAGVKIAGAASNSAMVFNGSSIAGPVTPTSWFDQAYCNTVGYLIVRLTSQWTCSNAYPANLVWFGADPTGATPANTVWATVIAQTKNIYIPAGHFTFNAQINMSLTGNDTSFVLTGAGPSQTILEFTTNSNGLSMTLANATQNFQVGNFSIETDASPGGSAILVTNTVGTAATLSRFYNIHIHGNPVFGTNHYWNFGIHIHVQNNIVMDAVEIYGNDSGGGGTAISIEGDTPTSTYAFNYYMIACNIARAAIGIDIGSYVQGVYMMLGGVDSTFAGIYVGPGLSGILDDLTVIGAQFDGPIAVAIQTAMHDTKLIGNTVFVSGNGAGFEIDTSSDGSIVGNHIEGTTAAPGQQGVGIIINNTVANFGMAISANTFFLLATPINLASGSARTSVVGNVSNQCTNAIVNGGTGNVLSANI